MLSKVYAQEGNKELQEIIVNAQIRIHEESGYDNWNGGMYGHSVYLVLPESLYLRVINQKEEYQNRISQDLGKSHNSENEYIDAVILEMEIAEDHDWRKESGVLLSNKKTVPPESEGRIWEDGRYRVFLSHKSEVKADVAGVKEKLKLFGVSAFVAHQDIHPTKEWQNEIENALFSMDSFVALMTKNFHESDWTDQEVGVAFGRGVPIVAIKIGRDPYGFIGKFQALRSDWKSTAMGIAKILIKQDKMIDAYIKTAHECTSYDNANTMAELLPYIDNLSDQQITGLISAFENNSELRGGFGFNGTKPRYYGGGLVYHLNRLTGRTYERVGNQIKLAGT
ncbi:TIR domain-containing protein [Thiohalophilus thiocyanatoxydans]|uniref:TIR domain-containing protein n=2 Tax=Thiohalophilus thiocyanatoxydans TaxID=381308 RepID=A0A4R8IQK3_9GAMM|nr:TIR domain-containing protein [Thiohalophilus thiocyanatoxydans]